MDLRRVGQSVGSGGLADDWRGRNVERGKKRFVGREKTSSG